MKNLSSLRLVQDFLLSLGCTLLHFGKGGNDVETQEGCENLKSNGGRGADHNSEERVLHI